MYRSKRWVVHTMLSFVNIGSRDAITSKNRIRGWEILSFCGLACWNQSEGYMLKFELLREERKGGAGGGIASPLAIAGVSTEVTFSLCW